jgi:hypothetical protein
MTVAHAPLDLKIAPKELVGFVIRGVDWHLSIGLFVVDKVVFAVVGKELFPRRYGSISAGIPAVVIRKGPDSRVARTMQSC